MSSTQEKLDTTLSLASQKPRRGRQAKNNAGLDSVADRLAAPKMVENTLAIVKLETARMEEGNEVRTVLEPRLAGGTTEMGLFQPGDVVWAKVPGYPYWPAEVCDPHHADENIRVMKQKEKFLQGRLAQGRNDSLQLVRFFNEKEQPWLWTWPEKLLPFEANLQQMKMDALGASVDDNEERPPKVARVPPAKRKAEMRARRREQQLAKGKTVVPSLTVAGEEMPGSEINCDQIMGTSDEAATPVGGTAEIAIHVLGTMRRGEEAEAMAGSNGDSFRGIGKGPIASESCQERGNCQEVAIALPAEPFALRDGGMVSVVIPSKAPPVRRKSILLKSQDLRSRFETAVKEALDSVRGRSEGLVGVAIEQDESGRPQKRTRICAESSQAPETGLDQACRSVDLRQPLLEKEVARRGKTKAQGDDSRGTSTGQDCSGETAKRLGRKPAAAKPSASVGEGGDEQQAATDEVADAGEGLPPQASNWVGNRRGRGGKRDGDRRKTGGASNAAVPDASLGAKQEVEGCESEQAEEQFAQVQNVLRELAVRRAGRGRQKPVQSEGKGSEQVQDVANQAESEPHQAENVPHQLESAPHQRALGDLVRHELASSSQETVQAAKQQVVERGASADTQEPLVKPKSFTKMEDVRKAVEDAHAALELQRELLREAEAARDRVKEELSVHKEAIWVAAQTVDVEGGQLETALHSGQNALNAKVEEANSVVTKMEDNRRELEDMERRKLELHKSLADNRERLDRLLSLECWWLAEPETQGNGATREGERKAEGDADMEAEAKTDNAEAKVEVAEVAMEDTEAKAKTGVEAEVEAEAEAGVENDGKAEVQVEEEVEQEQARSVDEAVALLDVLNLQLQVQERASQQQERWAEQKAKWASQVELLEERIDADVARVEHLEAELRAAEEHVASVSASTQEAERNVKDAEESLAAWGNVPPPLNSDGGNQGAATQP